MPDELTAAEKGKGSRITALVAVALALLVGAGAIFWFTRGHETRATEDAGEEVKSTLHLEPFVLNLADPEQRSYLRVGIDLGLNHEAGKGESSFPIAAVRDTILAVLAQARVEDLLTPKGKETLKQDLLQTLQERVPALGVKQVYFTEFLIQR